MIKTVLVVFLLFTISNELQAQYFPKSNQYTYSDFSFAKVKVCYENENDISFFDRDGKITSTFHYDDAYSDFNDTNWSKLTKYSYDSVGNIISIVYGAKDSLNNLNFIDSRKESTKY